MKSVALRTAFRFVAVPMALALAFGASVLPLLAAYAAWFGLTLWGSRSAPGKKANPSAALFMLFLFFGLPTALASVVAARWTDILLAYAIWFGLLGLLIVQGLLSRRVTSGEAVGWPFLMGMFLTMAAVPVLTLILRLT